MQFTINAPSLVWSENGLNIEAYLPSVQLFKSDSGPSKPFGNPHVSIYYILSDAAYDWTGGPSPQFTRALSSDPSHGVETDWELHKKDLGNPISVNGQDNSAATQDNLLIFVAGALVGIAGGALVGAIQEAFP
jgi:hypothetical protein